MKQHTKPPPWVDVYPEDLSWYKQYEPSTLPELFDQAVSTHGARTCTRFMQRTHSYEEIGALVNRAARGLADLGVGKHTHVGLLLPNTPTYVIFYYAILKTGASVVNFNPLYSLPELRHQVEDSNTILMITHDLNLMFDKIEPLLAEGVLERAVISPFQDHLPFITSWLFRLFKRADIAPWRQSPVKDRLICLHRLLDNDSKPPRVSIDPVNDVAVLQYTGGTTGVPKGAMLTHANLTVNVAQIADWASNLHPGEGRIIAILPFFHVFAMTTILNFGINYGMELLLVPKFELDDTLNLINKCKPTVMPGVPTLYSAILNHPQIEKYDLATLEFSVSGGASLPTKVKQEFEQLAGCALVEGYGLSETSPVATVNPIYGPHREDSIGLPLPSTQVSIRALDDPRQEMPTGESGEICLKGPQVMQGYWQKPDETEAVFVDGYFRTGDVGYMAEDGFFYLVDRLKDMINASGFKIYPRQIEDAIYRHPAVEEVVVIGIADDYRGEAPKAFVKLKQGHDASAEDILVFLERQISKLEMPEEIEFRQELPRTMVGKLSRKQLREQQT